jgi:HD-like signal output (HDOD) protein
MEKRFPQLFRTIKTRTHLPTLPHILLRLIEVCGNEASESEDISRIILSDASLSAKVMNMANPASDGKSKSVTAIDQAVRILGKNAIITVAISAADIQASCKTNDISIYGLKIFWRHSLMCALVSRRIAEKIAYLSPDEAYLTGLLHDIGKLILWINFPEEHADILTSSQHRQGLNAAGEARHEAAHYDIGAWLIKRWNLRSFMADAVLYHHEPLERVRNALPLVKIIYVGNALCSETNNDQAAAYKTAKNILGLEMSAAEEIIRQAEEEVDKISESLGIEFEPEEGSNQAVSKNDRQNREDLLKEVRNITLLQSTLQNLLEARDEDSILEAVQQGIGILFDVKTVVFFLYEPERNILQGKSVSSDQQHDLINKVTIPFQKEKSILATSLIQGNPLGSSRDSIKDNPTIIDEQIIRLVDKDGILCLPMAASQHYVGVIVLGLKEDRFSNLAEELRLLALFSKQAAKALHENYLRQSRANQLRADHPGAVSNLVRKVAHEGNAMTASGNGVTQEVIVLRRLPV